MRRVVRRWLWRIGVLTALLALLTVDARLKAAPGAGFVPREARWTAYAPRFNRFWSGVMRTAAFRAFTMEWPTPYRDLLLAVRHDTGIRPMSVRWVIWMGPRLLGFGTADGAGYCVRPGLLLRAAHAINARLGNSEANGLFRYGEYAYAWRDGFLLFSKSPEAVSAALNGPAYSPDEKPASDELLFEWRGTPEASMLVRAAESLPVRGTVRTHAPSSPPPPAVSAVFRQPFASLSAADCALASTGLSWLRGRLRELPEWTGLHELVPAWASEFPGARAPQGCAFALLEPVEPPEMLEPAAIVRIEGIEPPVTSGVAGPAPVTRTEGPYWLAARSTGTLDALMPETAETDATLAIHWTGLGRWLGESLQARARNDEALRGPIEGTGLPASRAIAALGWLEVEGRVENGTLRLEGHLWGYAPTDGAAK